MAEESCRSSCSLLGSAPLRAPEWAVRWVSRSRFLDRVQFKPSTILGIDPVDLYLIIVVVRAECIGEIAAPIEREGAAD